LGVLMAATFLDLVDVTIVNIAIPTIRQDIGASFSAIQWIAGGYALAFALGLITGGRLGDIYGRKKLFLIGVAGFTITSVLCGLSPTAGALVTSRVMQGAAAALMVPQVLSIIHVTFPPQERGKVFGMFGAMIGLGGVMGPLIGALLTQWNLFGLEWRPIFLINLPVGVLALYLGAKYISESKAEHALRLDLVGVALATIGLALLLYPLTQGRELGWPAWAFGSMIVGLAVLALFVGYERIKTRRDGSPLVELSLFRIKSFSAGTVVQLTYGLVSGIFFLVWTLYMQLGLGWSPLKAGLTGIPFSIMAAVAAGISVQKLVPKFGRKVLQAGAVAQALGSVIYIWEASTLGAGIQPWHMALPLAIMGIGMGLIVAPITNTVLSEVPPAHSGSASGLISTTNQLGLAFGLGLVSVAFFNPLEGAFQAGDTTAGAFAVAFSSAMWYVAAGLLAIFFLVFALPRFAPAWDTGDAAAGAPAGAGSGMDRQTESVTA